MRYTCHQCKKAFTKKVSARSNKGRPWKHVFCARACHNRWKAKQHLAVKARWLVFQRQVWGSTDLKRFEASKSKAIGRKAELLAKNNFLPARGFSDITDLSACSNQFYVDFVATYQGRRVLVDATVKLKASVAKKKWLADALQMSLYIIHVSPNGKLYHLNEIVKGTTSRIPAEVIRSLLSG